MRVRIEIDLNGSNEDLRILKAITKAMADCPPEGLVMDSGPPIKVHATSNKAKEAVENMVLDSSFNKDKDVGVVPTDDGPKKCGAIVDDELNQPGPKEEPKKDSKEDAEVKKELNEKARRLMKDVVKSGLSVTELKDKLSEHIEGDITKLDVPGLLKAIEIMEGLLSA